MSVFEDEKEKVVEEPKEEVVQEPPKKQKRKRKPLSASKKKALVERLKVAREKKKAEREKSKSSVPTPKKESAQSAQEPKDRGHPHLKKEPTKPTKPSKPTYREKQLEIQNLRDELEIQKLKNELESMRKSKAKDDKMVEEILADPKPVKESPKVVVNETPKVDKVVEKAPPAPPKKITHSLAPKNIWGMF